MKNKNIFKNLFCIVLVTLSILSIYYIFNMSIIPIKYIIIVGIVLLLLNIISIRFIYKNNFILRIISFVILVFVSILFICSHKYSNNLSDFFKKAFNIDTEIIVYDVIVLNDSKYNNINDLNNSIIGYLKTNESTGYLKNITNVIEANFVARDFSDLYEDLKNETVPGIVINEAYIDIYDEINKDFIDNTKVIYSFKDEISITKEKPVDKRVYNIYISGSDSRSGVITSRYRTDVNMIATVNLDTHEILLTSIPRDYYVTLHTSKQKDKLTHAGIYGIEESKKTLEDLFDIEIDFTLRVGFNSVIEVVDLIGGIDVYSDQYISNKFYTFNYGWNHFDGHTALAFARERHAYSSGDRHRVQNQQAVLEAIVNKVSTNKKLLLQADELLVALSNLYATDIPADIIKSVISEQIENMPTWKIEKQSVDGSALMTECYSMPGYILWTMDPDMDTVSNAKTKINDIISISN